MDSYLSIRMSEATTELAPMMILGFFTTFLMKQRLGIIGFGNAAFGSGLWGILSILTKLTIIALFLKLFAHLPEYQVDIHP